MIILNSLSNLKNGKTRIIYSSIRKSISYTRLEKPRWTCNSDDNLSVYIDNILIYTRNATDDGTCNDYNWNYYDVDLSAFADDATHNFSMVYTQPNTNGTTRIHLDNISVYTCSCPPSFTSETAEVCYGEDYTFPDGNAITNITEGVEYQSFIGDANGCITTIETIVNVSGGIPKTYDATPLYNTAALITWAAASGTEFYQVKYRIKGTSAWLTIGSSNPQRTLNNLTANKYYQYKIRSQCSDGSWSNFTEIGIFYSSNCDIPTGVASIYLDDTRVKIRWDNDADAYKGKVRYRAVCTSAWSQKNSTPGNNFVYITALTPNTDYEYRIRNNCNNGEWSAYADKGLFSTSAPMNRVNSVELKSAVNVFPNPTSGSIAITSNEDWNNARINIMDVTGKVLSTKEVSEQRNLEMNIKGAARIYFIEVISDGGRTVFRVVKK
jgi:hypothetical protein